MKVRASVKPRCEHSVAVAFERSDQLARAGVPELGGFVPARGNGSGAIWAELRVANPAGVRQR